MSGGIDYMRLSSIRRKWIIFEQRMGCTWTPLPQLQLSAASLQAPVNQHIELWRRRRMRRKLSL